MGYVSLRQRLFDFCDHEGSAWQNCSWLWGTSLLPVLWKGFVPKGNVVAATLLT